MNITRFTKSELWTAYNLARAAARRAGNVKEIERLNRALGILQSKAYYSGERAEYQPTQAGCSCKDWQYHMAAKRAYTGPCKHMLAENLTGAILASRQPYNVTRWLTVKTESEVNA
jgi:hypothetical protein